MAQSPTDTTLPNAPDTRPYTGDTAPLQLGQRLGRYQVQDILGSGGGGAVYAAWDETLKRRIALKVLHSTSGDPSQLQMLGEARALAQFSHPNVVAVYDVGEAEGRGFIAMEFAEGERLDDWLRRPNLPWHQVLKVFLEAGRGLAAVHRARLVHRDFKPGNVVVRADGRVQLIDFGIARSDTPAEGEPTTAAQVTGTPGFMAPEHMRGEVPSGHSDQFSFCCAVYDALLGVLPFGHELDTATLARIEKKQFAPAPNAHKVPRRVLEALRRGLAYAPEHRFRSMDELVRALARTLPLDRFRWSGLVALSVAAGSAIGFMWLYSVTRATDCGADVRLAQEVWTPALRSTFQSQLPARSLARVDTFAEGLRDASKTVCLQARSNASEPAAVFEARACLAHTRRGFAALLTTVQTAAQVDPAQVDAAVDALAPASECLDLKAPESDGSQARLAACAQTLFDAGALWSRGHWSAALDGAGATIACAGTEHAADLESNAQRLRGAVLERVGNLEAAQAAYAAAVRAALQTRGEPLALAWLSLARLDPRAKDSTRALELLEWTEALVEHVPTAPETRARAALMRLRLATGLSPEERQALVRAAAASSDDPGQRALASAARAQLDPAENAGALEALGNLPAAPLAALLEVSEALVEAGPNPAAAKRLLTLSEQSLASSGADAALSRSHFASVARRLGAADTALEVHRRILQTIPAGDPLLPAAVVTFEAAADQLALNHPAEALELAAKARALSDASPELRGWLSPAVGRLTEQARRPR